MISFSPAFNHLFKFFWALSGYSHPFKGGHQTHSSGFSHRSQQCHKMISLFINCSPVKSLHLIACTWAPVKPFQHHSQGCSSHKQDLHALVPGSGSTGTVLNHSGFSMGCTAQNTAKNKRVHATPSSQLHSCWSYCRAERKSFTLEDSWPWALMRCFNCPQVLQPLSSAHHPRKCPNTPLPTGLYQGLQTEGNPSPSHWWGTILVGPPAQSSTVRGSEDNLEHLPLLWVTHGKLPESPNSKALKGGANNTSSGHVSSCLVVGEHWPHTPLQNSQKSLLCV